MSATPYFPGLQFDMKFDLHRGSDPDLGEAEEEFRDKDLRRHIRQRDGYRCVSCGVALFSPSAEEGDSAAGLELHHMDGDHHNNSPSNIISLCPLCHCILHIGKSVYLHWAEKAMRVIWFPWLSQEELNLLTWTMAVAIFRSELPDADDAATEVGGKARSLARYLCGQTDLPEDFLPDAGIRDKFMLRVMQRSQDSGAVRGPHPVRYLCDILIKVRSLDAKLYNERSRWLGGLRIFFDPQSPMLFTTPDGSTLVDRMSASSHWAAGESWSDAWRAISEQFATDRV